MHIFTYRRISELSEELNYQAWTDRGATSEKIFVVPTRADMELLKEMILEKGGIGTPFPHIWRWGDLFREIQNDVPSTPYHRRQIDPPDHWLIIQHILEDMLNDEDLSCHLPGITQKGFASRLGDSLRDLMREEIEPTSLSEIMGCSCCNGEGKCEHDKEPEGILCKAYHLYFNYLKGHGLCDSAQVATLTRNIIDTRPEGSEWIKKRSFLFAGFLSFNHSQLKLVRALSQKAGELVIFTPQTGLKKAYTVLSQFEGEKTVNISDNSPLGFIPIQGGDRRLEIETIARELVLWSNSTGKLQDNSGTSFPGWGYISMTCPLDYIPQVEEVFGRYELPFILREGLTVSQTPLWELAGRVWDSFQNDWPSSKTARLLQEPFFCGDYFPVERFEAVTPSGEDEWCNFISSLDNPGFAVSFGAFKTFSKALCEGGTAAEMLKALRDLFVDTGSEMKISSYVMKMEELDETCRRMNAAIRETEEKLVSISELVENIGPAGKDILKGGKAFEFLSRWAETSTIWNAPSRGDSIEVYPGTPPVLARNRLWIFTGVSTGNWPGTLRETALLPDSRKEALHSGLNLGEGHLPLVPEMRRQKEYLFRRIIACGEELSLLSWPETDTSGRPLSASPFLERSLEKGDSLWASNTAGNGKLITRGLNRILPLDTEIHVKGIEVGELGYYPSSIKERILPLTRIEPEEKAWIVHLSSIDDWIACPFLYYCRHILRMEEKTRIGFDRMKSGIALHKIWEVTWKKYLDEGGSLQYISRTFLEGSLKECYPELLSDPSLKRHLKRFETDLYRGGDLQDRMEGSSIRRKDYAPVLEGKLPDLEIEGIIFRGRFDRLDILNGDNAVVIDYKSGNSSRFRNSMQLAAYCLLLKKDSHTMNNPFKEICGYGYLCHSDGRITGSSCDGATAEYLGLSKKAISLDEKLEKAEYHLTEMAGSIRRGKFVPDYDSESCRYCPYSGICRRQENPEGEIQDDRD